MNSIPGVTMRRSFPRYTRRAHLWLPPGEPVVCPDVRGPEPHKLETNLVVQQSGVALVCQHREGKQGPCGCRVWLLLVMEGPSKGWRYLAEVTPAETLHLTRECPTLDAALAYLGAGVP